MISPAAVPGKGAADGRRVERAVLLTTAAPGVVLQSQTFQDIGFAIGRRFHVLLGRAPDLSLSGAPVMAKRDLERSAYVERFPQLVASIAPQMAAQQGEAVETAMTPAACLSLYPLVSARPPIDPVGLSLAVTCACHRTEQNYGPSRLRTFTMSELVFFGRPAQVRSEVDALRAAVMAWLERLRLVPVERAANDPFYGRGAELMAQHQRALQAKTEIVLPIGAESEVACFSFNLHGEFFSQRWDIRLEEGGLATSACVGVGLERLALALIERHGDRPAGWPSEVRLALFAKLHEHQRA